MRLDRFESYFDSRAERAKNRLAGSNFVCPPSHSMWGGSIGHFWGCDTSRGPGLLAFDLCPLDSFDRHLEQVVLECADVAKLVEASPGRPAVGVLVE